MPIVRTTQLADAILSILDDKLQDSEHRIILEPYQNGREHGWCLYFWRNDKKVVFSQFRRSDDIVVYVGHLLDFNFEGNVPYGTGVYENKKFFKYTEIIDAVEYIKEYLFA